MIKVPEMTPVPPEGCPWRVGDEVKFTNEYGVQFGPYTVQGFTLPSDEPRTSVVYIDYSCYWFPTEPESLTRWYHRLPRRAIDIATRDVVDAVDYGKDLREICLK